MRCSFFLCLTPNQLFGFSRKYLGIDDALLPNREWNQKQKHKKTALEQCGMLRIWRSQKAVFLCFCFSPPVFLH